MIHTADPGLNPSERDGSSTHPFLDLRDAIVRATELSAAYLSANATLFISKGPHFIPLEEHALRYQPALSAIPLLNLSIK